MPQEDTTKAPSGASVKHTVIIPLHWVDDSRRFRIVVLTDLAGDNDVHFEEYRGRDATGVECWMPLEIDDGHLRSVRDWADAVAVAAVYHFSEAQP